MTNDQGLIVPALKSIFEGMKCISLMRWLEYVIPNLKNTNNTEIYVLVCLMIETVIALTFLGPLTQSRFVSWVIGILAVLRIVEIIGRAAVTEVICPFRTLVLAGINYVELALCFGMIYALNYHSLHGADRPITAFYFSVITQLTIGYGDVYPMGWMRVLAAAQGLIGAFFAIGVFARAITALPIERKKPTNHIETSVLAPLLSAVRGLPSQVLWNFDGYGPAHICWDFDRPISIAPPVKDRLNLLWWFSR